MLQLFSEMFDRQLFPASRMTYKERSHPILDTPADFRPISSSIRACVPKMHSESCHDNFGKLLTATAMNASFPVSSCSLHTLNSLREQTSVTTNNLSSLLGNIGAHCLPLV